MVQDSNPDEVGFFGNNVVAISGRRAGGGSKDVTFFVCGFIMSVTDRWFFVTAGHCLGELDEAIRQGYASHIRMVDYLGSEATNRYPYPFDYEKAWKYHLTQPNGVDIGVVEIDPMTRRHLESNRVRVHDEFQWKHLPDGTSFEGFHEFRLYGIPWVWVDNNSTDLVEFRSMMIPLEPLTEPPPPGARREQLHPAAVGASQPRLEL